MNLSIGMRHGCFTVIGETDVYQNEVIKASIEFAAYMRRKYELGELEQDEDSLTDTSVHKSISREIIESTENFNKYINDLKAKKGYKIQCKCGRCFCVGVDNLWWMRKKSRYCGNDCGLKAAHIKRIQDSYKREKDDSWYWQLENTFHESLLIESCVDDKYERLSSYNARLRYGDGTFKVYKKYKCKCYLCGKEHMFISSDFEIRNDCYGHMAEKGYYSYAHCDCHVISSFQWRTIKILNEHDISYKVEVTLPGLVDIAGYSKLKFDFATYNDDGTLKYLIECQGIQHYQPVEEFGGQNSFETQRSNDNIKRKYIEDHNLILIEIPYTCNTYEKEMAFLREKGIIS